MPVEITEEERDILRNWKKRTDTLILIRLKAEAVLYTARGVDIGIIAEMVDRAERTVRDWLTQWQVTRRVGQVLEGIEMSVLSAFTEHDHMARAEATVMWLFVLERGVRL